MIETKKCIEFVYG